MTDPRFSIIPAAAVTDPDAWALEILAQRPLMTREATEGDDAAKSAAFAGRCWYCGCEASLTTDHQIPKSRGGTSRRDNLVGACWPCNNRKRARTVEEYRSVLATASGAPVAFFGERS